MPWKHSFCIRWHFTRKMRSSWHLRISVYVQFFDDTPECTVANKDACCISCGNHAPECSSQGRVFYLMCYHCVLYNLVEALICALLRYRTRLPLSIFIEKQTSRQKCATNRRATTAASIFGWQSLYGGACETH